MGPAPICVLSVLAVACAGPPLPNSATLPVGSPEQVVEVQIDAYNRGDLEAFAATYAEDIVIGDLTGEPRIRGQADLRRVYGERFASAPDLHCRILQRIVEGDFVIDLEFITGVTGRADRRAVAVYRVSGGKIVRVWFAR